LTGYHLL